MTHISPPGDTIKDLLEEKGWTAADLAAKMGRSICSVNGLLKGEIAINDRIAQQLSDTIGSSKQFWLNREKQYREATGK